MKVKELKALLDKFPDEAVIIHTMMSEFDIFEEDDIGLIEASDKKIALRNGQYIRYARHQWAKNEKPEFVTVVHITGN